MFVTRVSRVSMHLSIQSLLINLEDVWIVQPISLGATFSKAVSKLKAQHTNVSFAMF